MLTDMLKYAIYEYVPQRRLERSTFEQREIHRRVLDFKDGRNYAKLWAARSMALALSLVNLRDVAIVCIPASSRYSHIRRYKEFTRLLCSMTGAINGFDWIDVFSTREKRHLSEDRSKIDIMQNTRISSIVKGQKILVIDDVCTTCATADYFIDCLRRAGAHVCMAMFLAKTQQRPW